jgi:hypothetical protein
MLGPSQTRIASTAQRMTEDRRLRIAGAVALCALIGVGGWWVFKPPPRPKVGDRHHLSYSIEPCAELTVSVDGVSLGGRAYSIKRFPDHGAGTLTITRVEENSSGDGLSVSGRFVTDDGEALELGGGTGTVYEQLSCGIRS